MYTVSRSAVVEYKHEKKTKTSYYLSKLSLSLYCIIGHCGWIEVYLHSSVTLHHISVSSFPKYVLC